MKKYLIGLLLLPTLLFGRNNADSLKFEIIKATINFLSTDLNASPKSTKKEVDCNTRDYDCLRKFCVDNNIVGAPIRVDEWKVVICNSKDELIDLIKIILTELERKEYRKELPKFNKLKTDLAKLPNKFASEVQPQDAPKEEAKNEPPPPSLEPKTQKGKDQVTNEADGSSLPLITFFLSLIALGLSGYTLFVKLKSTSDLLAKVKKDKDDIWSSYGELKSLVERKADNELISTFSDKFETINNRLLQLEKKPKFQEPIPLENRAAPPAIEVKPKMSVFYAKFPDMDNGFSRSIFLTNQNGEQIYEIRVIGDTSEFNISEDASAQKYAMSDFKNYLSSACEFLNQPFKDCRISTRRNGTLTKSAGNWIIQSKAQIEFL